MFAEILRASSLLSSLAADRLNLFDYLVKGRSVIPVPNQYKCTGCSLGKHPRHSNDGNCFR